MQFKKKRFFPRQPTEITCAECGKKDTVPFKPREGSKVLCKACFLKSKGIEPRKDEQPAEKAEEKPEETQEEKIEETQD
ncbi:MAG: hypothetical protein JSW08_03500 [archaeon]|nr:MAG: hypothetical protein JSW08_03500 [archaeon]